MMNTTNNIFQALPKTVKNFISSRWYEYLSSLNLGSDLNFMNYGYAALEPNSEIIELEPHEEKHRLSIQLYHHLAKNIDWDGVDALEVGCGRGGGASYLTKYFKPKSFIGLDITFSAIQFCKSHHSIAGLSFEVGNAEKIRFPDNSMDVIINVESSGNYPNVKNFLLEVARVLKPKGHFLYADLRKKEKMDIWRSQLNSTGLKLLRKENISENVLKALDLSKEKNRKLIEKYCPKILRRYFKEFAGMEGSNYVYAALKNSNKIYKCYVFEKPV